MSFLIIDWAKFIPALILLLTPIRLFHGSRVHFREIDRDWDRHWSPILSLWLHYLDFVRAALGTWLLLSSLQAVPGAHGLARNAVLLTHGSIRIFAVILQTVVCKEEDSANAPFAFLTGLLVTGVSPLAAVISLALVIPLTTGSRTPAAFFPLLAVAFAAFGIFFGGKALVPKVLAGSLAALVPWLWSLLFNRQLVVSYRSDHAGHTTPPMP